MKTAFYWAPRVLSIVFCLFIGLFALDAFSHQAGFWEQLAGFAIHLIPSAVCAIVVILAWRWEWVGAALFAALGVVYVTTMGRHRMDWNLIIAGPLFLLAGLFLAGWLLRARFRPQ